MVGILTQNDRPYSVGWSQLQSPQWLRRENHCSLLQPLAQKCQQILSGLACKKVVNQGFPASGN
jgi:hypothetical protein